ncbi:hypothetical protein NFJ02_30g78280 [Pycnococcus provasolii]|eukprot:CAMPEP_0119188550 /NCGR_PEP_ID=MMETSP1316-20130426/98_1 /TAXON_ID=41880 /ORGANISM="Pycnococcus provasolii, Strain RCC2336" /LENGTH=73 /DNA_ID=CAMNT_0007183013 /DNA_START=21 /DNA_END=242 /DNA_ORIENTATION=+
MANADAKAQVSKGVVGRRVQVTLVDKRTVEGTFMCIDKVGNIVLAHATSLHKSMGTVLVARRNITKLEVESVA